MRTCARLALLGLCLSTCLAAEPRLKVGIYRRGLGGRGVHDALKARRDVQASLLKRVDTDSLLAYDVVFVGSCALDLPAQVKALRVFVGAGGGLVLNHSACGRGKPQTLFPDVAKRVVDRREDTVLRPKPGAHPIAAGLPQEFEHAYYDHLHLEPGPQGTVAVVDREGSPVVVAGAAGPGRVVLNGSIPGYWYDAATYHQGEKAPEGGELQLVLNMVQWAGAGRLTALPADELARRRKRIEFDLKIQDMEQLLPTADWFGQEMLQGTYMPQRPVGELGGRFFITYDSMTWRGYRLRRVRSEEDLAFYRDRMSADMHRLKWLGVTDVILWTDVRGERVDHPTALPDSQIAFTGVDPLAELIRIATPLGLHVWAAWHSCARAEAFAGKYCAKDAKGEFYKYSPRYYVEDLLSPAYRERCRNMLDEYAEKYKPLGDFRGLACYDELWFCYADFHGDDLPAFATFCQQRFGQAPPGDMAGRLERRRKWTDAADLWRRRYILFKQHVVTDFWRSLVDHAHRRGLQVGVELQTSARYTTGWSWGMDSVALARLGADFYNTSCGEAAAGSYSNTYRWAHAYAPWGYYNTHCFRGGPGGIYFTFNQLWRVIMYGNNPALPRELARHIHNQRQWANAQSLARVAILHNQNALQMLLPDPRPQFSREETLLKVIQRSQDGDIIFTRAAELYPRYRVLVAPPYSVRGLSPEVYAALTRFVEAGGTIVSVASDWTVSKPDLTEERDVTQDVVGVTYGEVLPPAPVRIRLREGEMSLPAAEGRRRVAAAGSVTVSATFSDGSGPAITTRALGKGRVIGLHFDVGARLEKQDQPDLAACLSDLVMAASKPAVVARGKGFHVISSLKKGNWVAVALWPDQVPTEVQLSVDLGALGIEKDRFRMLMLGKRMEITRPGDLWGDSRLWSAKELAQGFRVTLVADHDRVMPLPDTFDVSRFTDKRRGKHDADYLRNITRSYWDSESRGRRKRTYAHEIVVLAPGDEPVMPGK